MEIDEQFVVDPLIVVDIQLSTTEKVDVSYDWNSSGGIRSLAREGEYGH